MRYVDPLLVVRQHLQGNQAPKWRIVVMCFHSKDKTAILAKHFSGHLLGYRVFSKCDESVVYEAEVAGEPIGILGWCTGGGPMVASLVEELSAIGVQYIIGIGAAASITRNILRQEMILPTELLVNDGTSRCYVGDLPLISIEPQMLHLFHEIKDELGIEMKEVRAATVEALYRQTDQMLEPWRKMGCEVVNWELTPFYAACEVCGIKCLWYGHISDVEASGEWSDWYCDRMQTFVDSVSLCRKIVSRLIEEVNYED